jgi:uncharacterized protein (DUF697 family)
VVEVETVSQRKASILNPVASAREVLQIVREMSFDDLHDAALRTPRVAIVAPTIDSARSLATDVFGSAASRLVVAIDDAEAWPDCADVVVLAPGTRPVRPAQSVPVVEVREGDTVQRTRQLLVAVSEDLELSLGRAFPELRQVSAMQVIRTTSRVNAQFALASNIPALVPIVGGLLAAGADTIVLTKNQLMMIYKLAAIHGRDIDNRFAIYREMVPVVGAGIFWRTIARDLADMMPFAAGAVPKVAIAFTGTFVAGMAAHVYYVEGKRASAARIREYSRNALGELRETPGLLRTLPGVNRLIRSSDEELPHVVEVDYTTGASARMP